MKSSRKYWTFSTVLILINCSYCVNLNSVNRTVHRRTFHSCISRVKRFVYFPTGSAALLTAATTKHLLFSIPRPWQMSLELDVLWDLPTNKNEWLPLRLKERPTPKPKPMPKPAMKKPSQRIFLDTDDPANFGMELHNGDYMINHRYPPEIHYKPTNQFQSKNPTYKHVFMYRPQTSNSWHQNQKPYNVHRWAQKIQQLPTFSNPIPIQEDWYNYRPHRERRELFLGIENAANRFGYKIRSCILRAICEAKHFLLPPGKSLIQDVIRIIFDIPTKPHWNDEYSNASRVDSADCKNLYEMECPVSVLQWALNNQVDISKL